MTFLESGTSFGWKDKMLSADAVLVVMLRCWKVSTNGVTMLWTLVDPCGPFSQATMVIRSCAEEMGKLDSVAGKAALKSIFWLAKIGGERSECVRGGYLFFLWGGARVYGSLCCILQAVATGVLFTSNYWICRVIWEHVGIFLWWTSGISTRMFGKISSRRWWERPMSWFQPGRRRSTRRNEFLSLVDLGCWE